MRIDRNKIRKTTSEVPPECQTLIDKLRSCSKGELLEELRKIETWTFGKCELYHWIDILDLCDSILEAAAAPVHPNSWQICCDLPENKAYKELVLWVLHFTTLLIEHSFSRHLYNSVEHLLTLLTSCDHNVVLNVLNLLYMFSKRSNYITRINPEKRNALLKCLTYLADTWGGEENGFGLADCVREGATLPPTATTLHYEFYTEDKNASGNSVASCIHLENTDEIDKLPSEIMDGLIDLFHVPKDGHMVLFTHLRLAHSFTDYEKRLKCVQARLQALSVLLYSNGESHNLLYPGLLKELVQVLQLNNPKFVDIRSAALRTLTSIIHLDRTPHLPKKPGSRLNAIIEATGANLYHGFLPQLVRSCITSLTSDASPALGQGEPRVVEHFPLPLATALFSFLYHLASYETGGEALVSCGMMECLLRVINWPGLELEHITFVTRAVRVIDLITNIEMLTFQSQGGLNSFINRLQVEVKICRKEQPFEIMVASERPLLTDPSSPSTPEEEMAWILNIRAALNSDFNPSCVNSPSCSKDLYDQKAKVPEDSGKFNKICLPQRAALLKSMLNFLKKALQDPAFTENIRHVMDGSLPQSLKHIISNAEYYGPSLFLLATDVVAVYVFQEPSLLSSLQDIGLTDVVLHALLIKNVPATREVLGSVPNVFSALCLNARGLLNFIKYKPFDKLFRVLLSPDYLPAMRRRRGSDAIGDTASNLGNAMDELMRHQPTLKSNAIAAIVKLLEELCHLGTDPKYVCWKPQKGSAAESPNPTPRSSTEGSSSDEEEDDEEEASTSSHPQREEPAVSNTVATNEKTPIALVDYVLHVMKFVDSILSNNSTDDHCKEFVNQNGLVPLLSILGLPNLPVEYPITPTVQAVASVCKSVLSLAQEHRVMKHGLAQVHRVLGRLSQLMYRQGNGGSLLLEELYQCQNVDTAFTDPTATPLLHAVSAVYGYAVMFIHICRSGQVEMRNMNMNQWSSEQGQCVLSQLTDVYLSLMWESTVLHSCCTDYLSDKSDAMEPSEEVMVDLENVNRYTSDPKTPQYVKLRHVKPLLAASCRLGRALAELFGLLVKMCVNIHSRIRRGHHTNPPVPTTLGHSIAETLGKLLEKGLNPENMPKADLKLQLSFLVCNLGIAQPMLFDEKKYPYHLMQLKFMSTNAMDAFFMSYNWAMSAIMGGPQFPNTPTLAEGSAEFMSSWFLFLEKLINPKAVLETFHTTQMIVPNCHRLDPMIYLEKIHKMAFDALKGLWGCMPLAKFSPKIAEVIIIVYRHIVRGEMHIQEDIEQSEGTRQRVTPLSPEEITQFSENALTICLQYVEILPECVFKISELLIVIIRRNGENFCYRLLNALAEEVRKPLNEILKVLLGHSNMNETDVVTDVNEALVTSPWAVRLAGCLHIYMLIFEEIKVPCAKVIHSSDMLNNLIMLLTLSTERLEKATPKWMAPLLLLIHQLEKVAKWINSMLAMHKVTLPVWRWMDRNSGKWTNYISSNNKILNEAYWRGDQHIHITSSRRRYSVSFQNMRQMSDSSSNNRPIMMAIMDPKDPPSKSTHENPVTKFPPWVKEGISDEEREYENTWSLTDVEYYVDFFHRRGAWTPIEGLSQDDIHMVLCCCMSLMSKPADSDTLHALLQLSVRYTRDYQHAEQVFAMDVVPRLLQLTQASSFNGFVGLSTMLIRHILEEPANISAAVEKILRFKTLPNIPPTFKELNYILRECEPAICRNPVIFKKVAKDILRVDLSILNKRSEEEDQRLLMKTLPVDIHRVTMKDEDHKVADTIVQLLNALVTNHEAEVADIAAQTEEKPAPSPQAQLENCRNEEQQCPNPSSNQRNDLEPDLDAFSISTLSMYMAASFPAPTYYTNKTYYINAQKLKTNVNQESCQHEKKSHMPLMTICNLLKLLADAVRSYNSIAKIIMDHKYTPTKPNGVILEECSAVAFVLDNLIPWKEDQDRMNMCCGLLAALASCNHSPESQCMLVLEVKAALSRALAWPESAKKHTHIQDLVGIITIMIENCPPVPITSAPLSPAVKLNQYSVNNMVKFMMRKGIVTDLARITLSLDLSSPKMASTVNAALKPLETLSRIMSQPSGTTTATPTKGKPKTSNASQGLTTTGNSNCHDTSSQSSQMDNSATSMNIDGGDDEAADIDNQPEIINAMINRVVGTMNNMGGIMQNVLDRNRIERRQRRGRNRVISELSRFGSLFSSSSDLNSFSNNDEMSQDSSSDDSDSNPIDQNRAIEDPNTDLDDPVEDEEEDDEEDDEDDDDDDDDQGDGNEAEVGNGVFNEDGLGLFEPDDNLFRIPGLDRETGDEFLMIEYSEPDAASPFGQTWSRDSFLPFSIFDEIGGNNRVPIQHPLLSARPNTDQPSGPPARGGQRLSRTRRYQYVQMNRAAVSSSPVFLQRLMSQNTTEPPSYLNIPGHPGNLYGDMLASTFPNTRLIVLENGLTILTNSEEEQINFVDQSGHLLGPSLAATMTNVPASMFWWNEEFRLLDLNTLQESSSSMIAAYELAPEFERIRNEELSDRKGKRKKMDDEEDHSNKKLNSTTGETDKKKLYDGVISIFDPRPPTRNQANRRLTMISAAHELAQATENLAGSIVDSVLHPPPTAGPPQSPPLPTTELSNSASSPSNGTSSGVEQLTQESPSSTVLRQEQSTADPSPPQALELIPVGPSLPPEVIESAGGLIPGSVPFPAPSDPEDGFFRVNSESVTGISEIGPDTAEVPRGNLQAPSLSIPLAEMYRIRAREEPGPSQTNSVSQDEVPEGVDPSFLAALPEEMRAEVLSEHIRLQRFQNSVYIAEQAAHQLCSGNSEVSADFLAALPPSIQEEVLAQQRMDAQRQANPNDPVDAAAFFQDLPHSLRQAILSDMEESQISVLPPDLAAEAHTLQREWQARNRQLMQERFLSHVSNNSSALSSILRHTGSRNAIRRTTGARYTIQNMGSGNRGNWMSTWNFGARLLDGSQNQSTSSTTAVTRPKGRQVLDPESISCLLVLLCVDDPRINTTRLHRVFRNLCYHQPTRDWLIRAILSIMEKCNESQTANRETDRRVTRSQSQQTFDVPEGTEQQISAQAADLLRVTSLAVPGRVGQDCNSVTPSGSSWLNIGMDAALGCRATVFQVNKTPGRRYDKTITINPQAAPVVYGHILEILISLARIFPNYFMPGKTTTTANASPKRKQPSRPDNFWDLLIRLDSLSKSKTGKSMPRSSGFPLPDPDSQSLENSPFGLLLKMVASPVVRRNSLLMDKLLRLLSHISISLHVRNQRLLDKMDYNPDISASVAEVINVITSEDCSEEGLENATALLLNITISVPDGRNAVCDKLMVGAHRLGRRVCQDIAMLLEELRVLNKHTQQQDNPEEPHPIDRITSLKGVLCNRFTKDTVVVTAPKKMKVGLDLQLASMAPLVSAKTSSQTKFLRILKVIVQLKDAVLNFEKKRQKEAAEECARLREQQSSSVSQEEQQSSSQEQQQSSSLSQESQSSSQSQEVHSQSSVVTVLNPFIIRPAKSEKKFEQLNLSERLILEELWETLSECLTELQLTQDTHAVLVLQPAVEAFFLVHASATESENSGASTDRSSVINPDVQNLPPEDERSVSPLSIDLNRRLVQRLSQTNIVNTGSSSNSEQSEGQRNRVWPENFDTVPPRSSQELSSNSQELSSNSQELSSSSPASSQGNNDSRRGPEGVPRTPPSESPLSCDNSDPANANTRNFVISQSSSSTDTEIYPPTQRKFLKFAEKHRTVLNQILRQSTTHLLEGPFKVLVNHTRVLDFDVKRRYFRNELERADEGHRREELAVHVRRNQVFEESFRELYRRSPEEWKNRFYIVFEGEEGQDAGGLLREWYVIISREIFNPMYALFTTSPGDRVTYMINPSSHYNPNHLCYFKFVGRVIAKAIYDNKLLECYFTRSFYKHILGILVKYTDMESEDYAFYKGLVYLMENPVDSLGYECVFSLEVQEFGVTEVRELVPNGRTIPVTEKNKMEYIRLVCQMKMTGNIRQQLNAFLEGFYDIIPKKLISIFNEQELELLISGLPNVDIEDLKANTEYYKYQQNSLQIQWFWRALREFDQAERAKFLQFVTGTSKVPLQGFAALEGMNGVQKFQIHRDERSTDRLPSAHTCFNQLDLPVYETYTKLNNYLLKAIHECSEGFGFA